MLDVVVNPSQNEMLHILMGWGLGAFLIGLVVVFVWIIWGIGQKIV